VLFQLYLISSQNATILLYFIIDNKHIVNINQLLSRIRVYLSILTHAHMVQDIQDQVILFLGSLNAKWVSPLTLQYYEAYIRRFLDFCNPQDLSELSSLRIMEDGYNSLVSQLSQKSWAPLKTETKRKYIKTMSRFCDWMLKRETILRNPFKLIEQPKKVRNDKRPCLKQDDIATIQCSVNRRWSGYLRQRNEMIVSFILATGLRRAEVSRLKVSDIEFRPIWAIVHVIGGKWDKDRDVFISDQFARALKVWIRQAWVYSEYLFPSTRWGPIGIRGISLVFQQISKRTYMHVYAHLLRHTYASTLVRKGVSLETVRNNMGHSDLKTTSIYITHDEDEHLAEMSKSERKI